MDNRLAEPLGLAELTTFVRRHPRLMVLTGAGCSTESGIPDYRDEQGEWKRRAPITGQVFVGDEQARRRYWARSLIGWQAMSRAVPGPAHHALARLEAARHVLLLVTQNVDGLHEAAGSQQVVDLHGRIDTVRCLRCQRRSSRAALQRELLARNPGWARFEARIAPDGDADLDGVDFADFEVPGCANCGGMLKPDVVFFGENVPNTRVEAAMAGVRGADALLVAGSSLMVYSGYRFVRAALAAGKPVAAVNLGRTRADGQLSLKISQPVGATLSALADRLATATAP